MAHGLDAFLVQQRPYMLRRDDLRRAGNSAHLLLVWTAEADRANGGRQNDRETDLFAAGRGGVQFLYASTETLMETSSLTAGMYFVKPKFERFRSAVILPEHICLLSTELTPH